MSRIIENAKQKRSKHKTGIGNIKERARSYTVKLEKRMIDNHKPLNLNSTQYNVGEEVLIRRKSRIGKIAPKRRHVLPRKVIGRHLNPSMYKVEFA